MSLLATGLIKKSFINHICVNEYCILFMSDEVILDTKTCAFYKIINCIFLFIIHDHIKEVQCYMHFFYDIKDGKGFLF